VWIQLVRFGFWVLYHPLAWMYDPVSQVVSRGRWGDWQRASLEELRGQQILELAFGTGNLLPDLHAAHDDPVGLELSPSMVRITRHKLERYGIALPLVQGRVQALPFDCTSFDSVLCTFPGDFIVAPATLAEIARVLRPGGRAVLVPSARLHGQDPVTRLIEWLYWITGQRACEGWPASDPQLASQLDALGLTVHTTWKPVGDSAALVVVLEKAG
jgi:ubiquinone/menaquinone biosynthesis C-methylase UbiE